MVMVAHGQEGFGCETHRARNVPGMFFGHCRHRIQQACDPAPQILAPGRGNMAHRQLIFSSPHFFWGRSAWTLLFVSVALVVYAVWWVLAAVLA